MTRGLHVTGGEATTGPHAVTLAAVTVSGTGADVGGVTASVAARGAVVAADEAAPGAELTVTIVHRTDQVVYLLSIYLFTL